MRESEKGEMSSRRVGGWVGALFLIHVPVGWGGFPFLLSTSEGVDEGEREGRDEFKKGWEMGWDLVSDARPCGMRRVPSLPSPSEDVGGGRARRER